MMKLTEFEPKSPLAHKKGFRIVVLEKILESPLDCKRSNQSILKEISPGYFGRNDAKAETPVLWPPHVKS